MKLSRRMNLRFMTKKIKALSIALLAIVGMVQAQEVDQALSETDSTTNTNRVKLDGIAAVIGDYVILESDIDKTLIDLQNQGASTEDVTRCGLLGKLMEDRLYAHQAVQDSLLVSDDMVNAQSDRQIQQLTQQIGSVEKMLSYYKKSDMESFREELFEINKLRMLSEKMQGKIVEEIEQIVKQPEAPEEEKQKVINQLKEIRQDVLENDASFNVKAILYSQDPGSKSKGGFYSMTKETPFVKEFKDVPFSLREGEISEPFETIFGYHIIYIEKIRGQELDLRHILMIPDIPKSAIDKAVKELDSIRQQVIDGKYTFAEAALNFSVEKETKFELTKMDPTLYNQVRNLKDGEISRPIREDDPRGGPPKFKIMKISNRYDEHEADFAKDYMKIQELALREKQFKAIKEWMDEHIEDTYIHVDPDNRDCDFANNWVKE